MGWKAAVLVLTAALLAGSAAAGPIPTENKFSFSLTGGYRTTGTFNNGYHDDDEDFRVDWKLDANIAFAAVMDYQIASHWDATMLALYQPTTLTQDSAREGMAPDTDLHVGHWHLGARYRFAMENFTPYVAATAGLLLAKPKDYSDTETRFSWSLGAGVVSFFNERWGLRYDARLLGAQINQDDSVFCDDDGRCYNFENSETMLQGDFQLGLTYSF